MKVKKRIWLVIGGGLVLFILIALLVVQYINVQGFKRTLSTLVESGTNGKYILDIGKTEIDHLNTCFTLHQISITKTDSNDSTGILQVQIPLLTVDMGSLLAMISSKQIKINEFAIEEPIAIIGLKDKEAQDVETKQKPINIAHHIVQFYPAIRTILDFFDVALFRIDGAGMNLKKPNDRDIQVKLLDLLISEWNMRHLSDSAQFKVTLGDQLLSLTNSEITFDAVEYNYKNNELSILDYTFLQRDSLKQPAITVAGASLKIRDLDYDQLISDEYYVLDQLLIVEPRVTANITAQNPQNKNKGKGWHPLSDILKKNLGTLIIQEGRIVDAQVELNIYQPDDTLSLHLPKMNLYADGFEVNEDSSTLMISNLNMDIHETVLELNEQISLKFSNLSYDEEYNVRIDSLEVMDELLKRNMVAFERVDLYNFSIFHYFYENDLMMDSLVLSNGRIHVLRDPADLNKGKGEGQQGSTPQIHVSKVHLENMNVDLELDNHSAHIKNISGIVENITKEDQSDYDLRILEIPELSYSNTEKGLSASLENLVVKPRSLEVDKVNGNYQQLNVMLMGFTALPENEVLGKQMVYHWNKIEMDSIALTGRVPDSEKSSPKKEAGIPKMSFGSFELRNFGADLQLTDTSELVANLKDLMLVNFSLQHGDPQFDNLKVNLANTHYRNGENTLKIAQSNVQSDSISKLMDLEIASGNRYHLVATELELGPWSIDSGNFEADRLLLTAVQLSDIQQQQISTVDSVNLVNLTFASGVPPYSEQVLIYAPQLKLSSTGDKKKVKKKDDGSTISPLKMFGKLQIYPGSASIDDRTFSFGKVEVEVVEDQMNVSLNQLAFKTPSSSIHVNRIWSQNNSLNLDSIYVVPVSEYLEKMETENDVLAARLDHIEFKNVQWGALIDNYQLLTDQMLLDGFDVSIRRDKTLPDPEHINKPHLFSDMIPNSDKYSVPRVVGRNGKLTYFEIGENTGAEGHIALNDITFSMNRLNPIEEPEHVLTGSASIYNQGLINYEYQRLDSGKFLLEVRITDLPMSSLNKMVDPLEAARFKSGHLHEFEYSIVGDSLQAEGQAIITYDDLHVEIFKKHQPDIKNFGSELLTLLVDKVILKHSKSKARAEFVQDRITFKSPINYWVKSGIHGASSAVLKGKTEKGRKKGSKP